MCFIGSLKFSSVDGSKFNAVVEKPEVYHERGDRPISNYVMKVGHSVIVSVSDTDVLVILLVTIEKYYNLLALFGQHNKAIMVCSYGNYIYKHERW